MFSAKMSHQTQKLPSLKTLHSQPNKPPPSPQFGLRSMPPTPTAVISAPSDPCYICVGCSVDCNGADSYDNDEDENSITAYKWTLGDGNDANTATASYTYKAADQLFLAHICTDQLDTPVPLDCYIQPEIPWGCNRCTTDYDELISVHYPTNPSEKCQ